MSWDLTNASLSFPTQCAEDTLQLIVGYFFQIRYKTNEPVWEEKFTFFIHNPKRQELEVEVPYLHVDVDFAFRSQGQHTRAATGTRGLNQSVLVRGARTLSLGGFGF